MERQVGFFRMDIARHRYSSWYSLKAKGVYEAHGKSFESHMLEGNQSLCFQRKYPKVCHQCIAIKLNRPQLAPNPADIPSPPSQPASTVSSLFIDSCIYFEPVHFIQDVKIIFKELGFRPMGPMSG